MAIRVLAFQTVPKKTLEERKKQIVQALTYADREKVDFICFPECFLTRYFSEKKKAYANSFSVEEALFQDWLVEIESFRATIIIGFTEKERGKLFNSAAVIERGKLLGVQRKHYLYYDYFTPGVTYSPIESKGISLGVLICLDTNYLEPARLLALQGAMIFFSPMCNKVPLGHPFAQRPPYYSHLVARSFENRCWLVSADWYHANDGKLVCPGHSVVYNHNGEEKRRSIGYKEQFLFYDIALNEMSREKGRRVHGSDLLSTNISPI